MESNYWVRGTARRYSRRSVLRGAALGAAGLAGAALIGCGGGDDEPAAPAAPAAKGTAAPAGKAAVADIPRGGTLTVGWPGEVLILDPHLGKGGDEHKFFYMLFDNLVDYGQDGLLDPAQSLANKWEYAEPTKLILSLRPGIKIAGSDEAVDAELVKWNLQRATSDRATPRSDLGAIKNVEVVDPLKVVVNLNTPSAPLLTNLGDRGGFIVSRKQVEKLGDDGFGRNPLGSGAMKFKEWISDVSMTFEANKEHWGKDKEGRALPYLDRIVVKNIPDQTVRVAALESGEIDITPTPATEFKRLSQNTKLAAAQFVGSGTALWYINHDFKPMDNLNFRKAIAFALDRETYIKNFLTGEEPVALGHLTPASWAYDKSVKGYKLDKAEAVKLLRASGLAEKDWRVNFQPFGASISQAEEFWQAGLKEVGITIDWAPAERNGWTKVLKGLGGAGSSAAYYSGWSMRVDPDANLGQFYLEKGGYNSGQSKTAETEALIVKARAELDVNKRKELYTQIQQKALDNVYSAILTHYGIARDSAQKKVGGLDRLFGGEGKHHWHFLWINKT